MDKLKYIRVQQQGGIYSSDIPIAADAHNISMLNGHDLQETLGDLNVTNADDVTTQLSSLHSSVNSLNQQKIDKNNATPIITSVVTNWLNTNVDPTGSAVTVDKSLTIENSAADAKNVGALIKQQKEIFQKNFSPNLFNKNHPDLQVGKFINSSGWNNNSNYTSTHPIFVEKGVTYKYKFYPSRHGSANHWGIYVQYPGDISLVGGLNGVTVTENGQQYILWTSTRTGYACFNLNVDDINNFMFCRQEWYPNYYINYGQSLQKNKILKQNQIIKSLIFPNLFYSNNNEIQTGKFIPYTGSGYQLTTDNKLGTSHKIQVFKNQTYRFYNNYNTFGTNRIAIAYIDDDYNIISKQIGNSSDNQPQNHFTTWTASRDGYIIYNINLNDIKKQIFSLNINYPYEQITHNNYLIALQYDERIKDFPLFNKKLICDGDSIMSATPDDPKNEGGWFGRLQKNQKIIGKNYAVGGGTITANLYYDSGSVRHSVCRSIDTIYEQYPELDYLILEGGTNDADIIGHFNGDTPPTNFGAWIENNFSGSYDDTTFCGAVESMFYKALTYWPNAKIGFIIAMQMGTSDSSSNNRKRYFDEIEKIAKKWHIPVLNLWENSGVDSRLTCFYDSTKTIAENVNAEKFYRDGQHPSSYGYDKMQPMVESWIKSL